MGNIVAIVYTRIYNQQGSLQKEVANNKQQFTVCLRDIRIDVDNGNRWRHKGTRSSMMCTVQKWANVQGGPTADTNTLLAQHYIQAYNVRCCISND
jgi:hypothetical protein